MPFKIFLSVLCTALLFSCHKKETPLPAAPANDTVSVSQTNSVAAINPNAIVETTQTSEETASAAVKSNPKPAVQHYFQSVHKMPQVFTINASKESKITGAEKTTLTFPPNAFVSTKTGKPISGNITVKLTEYYQLSDMVLANLSTTTNGKLLETGGMFYVEATSGDELLELQKGKSYSIEFPEKSNKPGMEIYNGQRDQNGNINWTLDNNSEKQEPEGELEYEFVTFIDELAIYPGGNEALYQFISRNFEVPEDNAGGTLLVSFVVETDGNVSDVKVLRGLTKVFDNEAIRVVKKLNGFTPAKRKGAAIRSLYTLPIRINSEYGSRDGMSSIPITQRQKIVTEATNSFFSATRLGWINCDRLWKNNNAPKLTWPCNWKKPETPSLI